MILNYLLFHALDPENACATFAEDSKYKGWKQPCMVDKQRCSLSRSEEVADNPFTSLLEFPAKWPSLLPGLFNRNRTKVCVLPLRETDTQRSHNNQTQTQTTGQEHSHDSLQAERDSDSCGRQTEGRRHKEFKSGLGLG